VTLYDSGITLWMPCWEGINEKERVLLSVIQLSVALNIGAKKTKLSDETLEHWCWEEEGCLFVVKYLYDKARH
jgi:hypothetical protein